MNNICYNGLTGRFDSWMNDGRAFTDYRPSGDSHTDFLNQVKSVGCNANNNDGMQYDLTQCAKNKGDEIANLISNKSLNKYGIKKC
jgi:hypothetical protein